MSPDQINAEIYGIRIENVCEKLGEIFYGEEGAAIGRELDELTSSITIVIDSNGNK